MQDRQTVFGSARSGIAAAVDSLVMKATLLGMRAKPMLKTYGPTLAVMAFFALAAIALPESASAQSNVWTSLNNINANAQRTLLKVMVTVGIAMILVGAWMWKQEKGGAVPVLLLGVALIVVGGLTASNVLTGIGAGGSSTGF